MKFKCKKCFIAFGVFITLVILGLFFILNTQAASAQSGSVVINEIAWMGTTESPYCEWIELFNTTDSEVDLLGWKIYEQGGDVLIMELTQKIAPNNYYLVGRVTNSCPDAVLDITADDAGSFGGSGLSNSGEYLKLLSADEVLIDSVDGADNWMDVGDNSTKATMERTNEGTWQTGPVGGTPRAQNSFLTTEPEPETEPETEQVPEEEIKEEEYEQPKESTKEEIDQNTENLAEDEEPTNNNFTQTNDIKITEFIPWPKDADAQNEWIEIYNAGEKSYDLTNWMLAVQEGKSGPFTFTEVTISPKEYRVFWRPATKLTLINTGDTLKLLYPDGSEAQFITYPKPPNGQSYALVAGEWMWTDNMTPGYANLPPSTKQEDTKDQQNKTVSSQTSNNTDSSNSEEEIEEKTLTAEEFSAQISKNSNNTGFIVIFILVGILSLGAGIWFILLKNKNL